MILDKDITAREMRALEINSEYLGVSKLVLMENAGRSIAHEIMDSYPPKSRIMIACGLGGNGGDGFVAARHLAGSGYRPEVILLGRSGHIRSSEAAENWGIIASMLESVTLTEVHDSSEIPEVKADVIVDALIGTGVTGPLRAPYRQIVDAINNSKAFKISVDIPTGVNADTGETYDTYLKADKTITFHKKKKGQEKIKNIQVRPIGLPPEAETQTGPGDVYIANRERRLESHKGDFGRLLVIGGSETYSGAPALTALGAYAAGVDLVYVAAPESAAEIIAGFSPSLVTVKLKGSKLTKKNLKTISSLLERVDAVVVGPGLGIHPDTFTAVNDIVEKVEAQKIPLLLDADALKAASGQGKRSHLTVFTPHRREFEILTGKKVNCDLKESVLNAAGKLGGVILLKGNVDVISDGSHVRTNHTGNPGMTVGGTGDVLAGVCTAYMSMGVEPFQAACTGAFINGAAGDYAYSDKGYNFKAEDVVNKIPFVIKDCIAGKFRSGS